MQDGNPLILSRKKKTDLLTRGKESEEESDLSVKSQMQICLKMMIDIVIFNLKITKVVENDAIYSISGAVACSRRLTL
ncbi:hypothetical protein J4Q44_G00220320 [Coregonus suidteri]|uniref:Uncharacterized protein n=1 Tax=Coregonus suidteri TaxID=861788 RepID=A0AAN8LCX2_9TELE